MKFLNWCLGFLLLVTLRDLQVHTYGRVTLAWWAWIVFWSLLGVVYAVVGTVRAVTSRMRAAASGGPRLGAPPAAAPKLGD